MNKDLEYAFKKIYEISTKISNLTKEPELGCFSYFETINYLMDELNRYKTIQEVKS